MKVQFMESLRYADKVETLKHKILDATDTTVPQMLHVQAKTVCHFTIFHIKRGTCETSLT
jgi:hypothetical protein